MITDKWKKLRSDFQFNSLFITLFNRPSTSVSVRQAEEWVSERMQKMAEDSKADLSNLQTKMKLLQKHQVFEAEILAHHEIISNVLLVRTARGPAVGQINMKPQ